MLREMIRALLAAMLNDFEARVNAPKQALFQLHTEDDLSGCSVRGSVEFFPRTGDVLHIDSEVCPEVYGRFSELSSAALNGPLFLKVLFVEQFVYGPKAVEGGSVPVIHVQPIAIATYGKQVSEVMRDV